MAFNGGGGSSRHIMLGLSWPCMCICWGGMCIFLTIPGLCCLEANCVSCQHLQGYSTLCVCWIEVCGLFGNYVIVSGHVKDFYVWSHLIYLVHVCHQVVKSLRCLPLGNYTWFPTKFGVFKRLSPKTLDHGSFTSE